MQNYLPLLERNDFCLLSLCVSLLGRWAFQCPPVWMVTAWPGSGAGEWWWLQELSSGGSWDGEQPMRFLPWVGQNRRHSIHLLRMGEDGKAGRKDLACRDVCTANHCSLTGGSGLQLEPMKRSEHGFPFLRCLLWDVALFSPISHRNSLGGTARTEPFLQSCIPSQTHRSHFS